MEISESVHLQDQFIPNNKKTVESLLMIHEQQGRDQKGLREKKNSQKVAGKLCELNLPLKIYPLHPSLY